MSKELSIPKTVLQDPSAIELLRVWEGEKVTVTLQQMKSPDPAAWGLLLVDIARHVAKATQTDEIPESKILARIKQGFDVEWESPDDTLKKIE